MDDQLRRTLNDKLDSLNVAELVPDFDRRGTWAELEARLDAGKSKRRALPVWSYVAAAALAGMILGGTAVRFLSGPHPKTPALQIAHRFPAVLQPQADDAPAGNVVSTAASNVASSTARIRRASQRVVHPQQPPLSPEPDPSAAGTAPESSGATPVTTAVVSPRRPRAVHLIDIDAQSRTAILGEPQRGAQSGAISQYIMVRAIPPATRTDAPAAIIPRFQ